MSETNPFSNFDKKTIRLIKNTALELGIDESLAANIITEFERNCNKYIKFRWNFRIPALGLFYLSTAKTKKQNFKNGKEDKLEKKTNVLLETKYNAYIDKKREAYRNRHSITGEQSSGGTENNENSSSGS